MEKVIVDLGSKSYPILIDNGLLDKLGYILKEHFAGNRILVVTDSHLSDLYSEEVMASLGEAGFNASLETIPAGEVSKSLRRAELVYNAALEHGLDRKSAILALGGGVVGDLAGFIAATYMRGIDFIQVPTSLLAQVDSSVGGKVAVNLDKAKNMVGAFYQPRLVLIDPGALRTLPAREFNEGLAEVIKYGIIRDEDFFCWLERNIRSLRQDAGALIFAIKRSCEIKASIVAEDERESGLRMILNCGHTVAHALEAVLGYGNILHGEAVALGLVIEAKIALHRGLIDRITFSRIQGLVKSAVPMELPRDIDENLIIASMSYDKKNVDGKITFVLPQGLGKAGIYTDVTREEILSALVSA
ncbi:3-dehydroquinate synthase [Thermoanaerobacterium sp. DL9XJH110]|uniref:3-dehydroquinate synthase n=1 Tax=Thermoanaerobacterium sp. DL9XJH110 TaxID=3386643 RepID=UPI003BB5AA28